MSYQETIKYLESFIDYEKISSYSYKNSFNLGNFQNFLDFIGNPQKDLKVIHIAGSKGKGSTCAFIAYMLREAGFRAGLYTSPHLVDFRERIRVLEKTMDEGRGTREEFEGMISKRDICGLVSGLKPLVDKFNKTSKDSALTFFEVYTALAFQYFKDKKVDFVVLETGLGGRLDATNVCSSLISAITPISYEHTKLLGKTLSKIAFEKASIIKKENKTALNDKIIALTSKQNKEAMCAIENAAKKNNALLLKEGKDFKPINYRVNLLGKHQISNASLAAAATKALKYHNIEISKKAISNGLRKCRWPARFEIISKNPLVIIDGAQNADSVKTLRSAIKEYFPNKKVWLIFGINRDKELKDTCKEAGRISDRIILTKSDNPRASEPKDLLKYFSNSSILLTNSTKEAINLAKEKVDKNDIIVITGSLYICGEIREKFYGKSKL